MNNITSNSSAEASASASVPAPGDRDGRSQTQAQHTPLMGIAHRHDEALSHNPTPSETLMERRNVRGKEDDTAPLITGTLGASPSRSAGTSEGGGGGGAAGDMPRAILFPEALFGEAAAF